MHKMKDFEEEICSRANEQAPERVSPPKPALNAGAESSTATRSSSRSSAAMILARVAAASRFKKCCMRSERFDGVNREHYERE